MTSLQGHPVSACTRARSTVRRPIAHVLELLDPDLETRELLRLVAEGEGATVAWLRAYHASLRG